MKIVLLYIQLSSLLTRSLRKIDRHSFVKNSTCSLGVSGCAQTFELQVFFSMIENESDDRE